MPNQNESGHFFEMLSSFAKALSPIVGVIVLVLLAILIWEIIKFIKGLDTTVNKINNTIESVDKSVEKIQVPLNTVASISQTVDTVHAYSKRAVGKSVSMVTDNYEIIKDWVSGFFKKDDEVAI